MGTLTAVTFAELVEVLRQYQYTLDPAELVEGRAVFGHPTRSIRIILPAYQSRSRVREGHLAVVRHFLAECDDAEAREFDAWLEARGIGRGRGLPVT